MRRRRPQRGDGKMVQRRQRGFVQTRKNKNPRLASLARVLGPKQAWDPEDQYIFLGSCMLRTRL